MHCPKCSLYIDPADVRGIAGSQDSIEIGVTCLGCGERYAAWIDHTAWRDIHLRPVCLAPAPAAMEVRHA